MTVRGSFGGEKEASVTSAQPFYEKKEKIFPKINFGFHFWFHFEILAVILLLILERIRQVFIPTTK